MLHKSKSKRRNKLKVAFVLPIIGIFLMSFNTKTIFIEKASAFNAKHTDKHTDNFSIKPYYFHEILKQKKDETKPKLKSNSSNLAIASKPISKPNFLVKKDKVKITKDFSKADLEKIAAELEQEGITIKFKGIKRNKKGEIIAINISAKTKNSEVKYSSKDDDAINPITISFDDNNISIGDSDNNQFIYKLKSSNVHFVDDHEDNDQHDVNVFVSKSGKKHKLKKTKMSYSIHSDYEHDGKSRVIIIDDDNDNDQDSQKLIIKSDSANVWSTDEDIIIKKYGKNKSNFFFISGDDNESPLFILNGKEVSKEELDKLEPNSIKSVTVIKDEKATSKYGEKGKHGVVEISTK